MAFTPITQLSHPISALADRVTGRADYVKQYFDGNALQLMAAINAIVEALNDPDIANNLGAAKFGNNDLKYIRLGAENRIEVSEDGVTWKQPIAGHAIYTEGGVALPQANGLVFVGATVTNNGDTTSVSFPGGLKGEKGDPGADGADGVTPQRGTDYWTAADQAQIIADVKNALSAVYVSAAEPTADDGNDGDLWVVSNNG